ncbi:Nitric oxide reductase activation protein [Bhargavaea cecembensis DSE10]|uniref:Nitric oxide reductase activation protein n=1 Tax=Bhargavaea cecembensis DSE10 TaxID=1235279 RepID=M7NHQ3_9BACL|nr:VWA domain-containing protein [Bhargavaea cecembensis]EMR06752.1 Nitric oxide reductase activation protein [Bhargavaea cecembensis DSE10]
MTSINRFIDFNDELIDAGERLRLERLARALTGMAELGVTERQHIEFHPASNELAMSVFWRHRDPGVTEQGRLSDLYLLAAGFWSRFDLAAWREYRSETEDHPLREFLRSAVLLFEELRITDAVIAERPGTDAAFALRRRLYGEFHTGQQPVNLRRGFRADALFNHLYAVIHGIPDRYDASEGELSELVDPVLFGVFDARSTADSVGLAERLAPLLYGRLEEDLRHSYYAVGDGLTGPKPDFHYHRGTKDREKGEAGEKESVGELFSTWHAANRSEKGMHLNYELEHGRIGEGDGTGAREGREGTEATSTGRGQSSADERTGIAHEAGSEATAPEAGTWTNAEGFGSANESVVFRELLAEADNSSEARDRILRWREESAPHVRAIVKEMQKRIERKREERREGLPKGRLSKNPVSVLLHERPRPFYRKQSPSKRLDAVFGLLVDGSGSMADKLDQTKKAVLLFHDILRSLETAHGIAVYQEDSAAATKTRQPNTFQWLHRFRDDGKDNGERILSLEAGDDNRDGFAVRWMTSRLLQRSEAHRFLLVFSDGEPSAFGYGQNGIVDTAEAVREAEKQGITVIHLFLSSAPATARQQELFRMMFGSRSVSADSIDRFSEETLRILRKLLVLASGNM